MDENPKELPPLECLLHLIYSMEISYHFFGFLKHLNLNWEHLGYEREIELQEIEGLMLYHKLGKLNLTRTWKEIYTNVNYFCNNDSIIYKNWK